MASLSNFTFRLFKSDGMSMLLQTSAASGRGTPGVSAHCPGEAAVQGRELTSHCSVLHIDC